jgi:ubiquinone/menaquinone biosynthesis C-methylase UbiE
MIIVLSDPLKETRRAYEEIAERYNQENHSYNAIVDELTEFLGEINGNIILDIGSGHGRDSKYFSDKGFTAIGIDLSVELTRIARNESPVSAFLLADMRYLPFRGEIANGLWVCASFHHLPRSYAPSTLSGFNDVLSPVGVMHLSVKKGDYTGYEEKNRYHGKPRFYSYY